MAELTITEQNFEEEVIRSPIPVLLDFWAPWCGPCRMIAPIVAEIAEDQAGKVKVGKINVDEQPRLAAMFNVTSIPLVVVMKGGNVANFAVGYRPKAEIEALLTSNL